MTLGGKTQTPFIGRVATLGTVTFLSAVFSLALLPIATKILDASDYGTYALLMSLVTLISTAMDGGSSLFLPAVYHRASPSERGRMITTAALIAATGGIAISALAILIERTIHSSAAQALIPLDAMLIAAITVPLRSAAVITTSVFSITNRSRAIALQTIVQAASVFVFTIAGLFWLSLGGTSLLFGAACGQLAALSIGVIILNKHGELFAHPSREWVRLALRHSLTSSSFGFVGGAHSFAENSFLTAERGLHAAGFLNHARLYQNFALALIGAVGHNVKAASLEEARNPESRFEATRKAWTPVHIALTCVGLLFASFGDQIVDVISNGKLNEAAPYIPFFMLIALIQNSDQAATATIYASGQAHIAVRFQTALALLGLMALYPLIQNFGIVGIIAIILVEIVMYRVGVAYLARRLRAIPFQDAVAYFGCILIMVTALWMDITMPALESRIAWMTGAVTMVAFAGRRSIAETLSETLRFIGVSGRS